MKIDQLLPSAAEHDAITNHALHVRRALQEAGYESEVYAEIVNRPLDGLVRHESECPRRPDGRRLLLYHGSTGTSIVRWLIASARQGQAVAVDYHNITPAGYFTGWDPGAARRSKQARRQLAQLAPVTRVALADSPYNQQELQTWGYRQSAVSPLLIDIEPFLGRAERPTAGRDRWLFVGRIAPNKGHHDLISAFAVYRKLFKPDARLRIVGWSVVEPYRMALEELARRLGVGDSIDWLVAIPPAALLAEYEAAGVFVCLSDHEGFCVPLVEAMAAGVPVVAFAAGAVADTVADAGVVLGAKDPLLVACTVDELLGDESSLTRLVQAGRDRAASFALAATAPRFVEAISAAVQTP